MPQAPRVGASQLSSSKLDIVLAQVDANGFKTAKVLFEHIVGCGLQDDLQLLVLIETVAVFTVAAVGWAAAGLNVGNLIGLRTEYAQKCFGRHGAGPDFEIVRFLDDGATVGPVALQFEDCVLKGIHRIFTSERFQ